MGRRTRRWRAPKVEVDHAALFAEEAKAIVRGSGLLDAYRKSSGLLLREIRTQVARERLAPLMGDRCRAEYSAGQHHNLLIAKEIAARHARLAWTGEWWTATPCIAELLTLLPGDAYFTRTTVSRIIEQMGEPALITLAPFYEGFASLGDDIVTSSGALRPDHYNHVRLGKCRIDLVTEGRLG